MKAGLKTVVALAFFLAIGFTMVILSCALWNNWLPLIVAFTFVLAPLPNSICGRLGGRSGDYMGDTNPAYIQTGHFLTSFVLTSALCIPFVLLHSKVIEKGACALSLGGGGLVWAVLVTYGGLFGGDDDADEMGY